MLAVQLLIVLVVLVGVAAVSLAQSNARFRETEGRRALAVAEWLAVSAGVREAAASDGAPNYVSQAQSVAESGRTFSGSSYVVIAVKDRRIIASTDPVPKMSVTRLQDTNAFLGRSWVGEDDVTGAALAMAPIINERTRETDGVVAVGRQYPSLLANLAAALPNLLTYLGIASLLGVIGSLLLARTVKRQTLGLEPREITGLVEQREALLHGIKEGVLAIDLERRITMVNDEAAHLLGIPLTSAGRSLAEVDDTGRLLEMFDGPPATDQILPLHGRVLTLNRMPVRSHGRHIGWVGTFRDRTELLELQRELDVTRNTTDTLRAQAHEFSNRMHIISGLIELGEYGDVRSYIRQVTADQTELTAGITARVADPAVAALLIAKSSQAAERGVSFVVEHATLLARLDERLATDVSTVLGNLVDNALDAAARGLDPHVAVEVSEVDGAVRITVHDSGPGVDTAMRDRVFSPGFSTKVDESGDDHGIGLALVRVICRQRGGEVSVHNDRGAVFVATLPVLQVAPA
ncbi:ATP-binding protein [Kribbella endophytica]